MSPSHVAVGITVLPLNNYFSRQHYTILVPDRQVQSQLLLRWRHGSIPYVDIVSKSPQGWKKIGKWVISCKCEISIHFHPLVLKSKCAFGLWVKQLPGRVVL